MSDKSPRPPAGASWSWLTRDLLESDAWRSMGINARRVLDFLQIELMNHGGKDNGRLKATHRQLLAYGIPVRYVADAIRAAEKLGLVDCQRGGMRVATTYGLTWVDWHDGTPATNRWRSFRNPDLTPMPVPKSRNLPDKGKAALPNKGKAVSRNLPNKGKTDRAETAA